MFNKERLNRAAEEAARLYEQMVNDYIYLSRKGFKVEARRLEAKLLAVREVAQQLVELAKRAEAAEKASTSRKREPHTPYSTLGETVAGPGPCKLTR